MLLIRKRRRKIIDYALECGYYKNFRAKKERSALNAGSHGSTTKFAREQRAEKSCKQVVLCISRRMRNTSNQLFPKRSDERARVSLSQREREKRASLKEKTGVQMCRKFARRVSPVWRCDAASALLATSPFSLSLSLSLPFPSHRAFRHELSAPKSSATCTRARKTPAASRTRRARFASVWQITCPEEHASSRRRKVKLERQ